MRTIEDKSYGVIPVCFKDGVPYVLLIHQISNDGKGSYWILPKGHAEKGELPLEAAKRELHEETGIDSIDIHTDEIFSIRYVFMYEGDKIYKQVDFYVGLVEDCQIPISLQVEEVKEARWCDEEEAYEQVTHKNARELLKKVFTYLRK